MSRQQPVLPYQPRLVEAAERSSALSAQTRNLATHFTLSVRMISITSRVPTSSRPARASPSRMFASMSKACEDMPAWTWSLNVARGVYVCERANIGSERMRSGTKGARRER